MAVFVYVITDDSGRQKIGFSGNPSRRAAALQQATDVRLSFSLETPAALAVERLAHSYLRDHRLKGEWFGVTTERAIETVLEAHEALKARGVELFSPLHIAARASAALV